MARGVAGTEALRKYRELKKILPQTSKEYQAYVKEYYGISKRLRKGKVVLRSHKQGLFESGKAFILNDRTALMDEIQFEFFRERYGKDLTATQVATAHFRILDLNTATTLKQNIELAAQDNEKLAKLVYDKNGNFKYTLEQIRARQLPTSVWNEMTTVAENEGLSNSSYYFGS